MSLREKFFMFDPNLQRRIHIYAEALTDPFKRLLCEDIVTMRVRAVPYLHNWTRDAFYFEVDFDVIFWSVFFWDKF
jgi:hypothetical protein